MEVGKVSRYLIVTHKTALSAELRQKVGELAAGDASAEFAILVPELHSLDYSWEGECVDVAKAAAIQISRCRVMDGVGAAPQVVRRHGDNADHAADPIIGKTMTEEGAVAAIVLDHEETQQKAGGRHREQQ